MRLDAYVAKKWPEHSRSTWQKYIELGYVFINGDPVSSTKHTVSDTDEVVVRVPEAVDYSVHTLPIIYEDENVVVIDKPVGVLTHSKGALNDEFTVAEFVRTETSYKTDTNRPGIIHRLDRATSGVLVCVKNDRAASLISKQFTNRTVKKQYAAVVSGVLVQDEAVIDVPIGRNPNAPSTFKVDVNGKSAETHYKILRSTDRHSLVALMPKTGRTHQLRVHMAYMNTPIVGDTVYGNEPADRMYLHAERIELTLPGGERKVFISKVPDEFKQKLQQ